MDLHPVLVRVLKFKLGEVKLSAAAEKALALDYYRYVTGDDLFGGSSDDGSDQPANALSTACAAATVKN
jgi:hypothetical protein